MTRVWLLFAKTLQWDDSESTDIAGVFSTPSLAIAFARRDRIAEHSGPSGPIVPDVSPDEDAGFVRLNERYVIVREDVDPRNAGHVCSTATCTAAIG